MYYIIPGIPPDAKPDETIDSSSIDFYCKKCHDKKMKKYDYIKDKNRCPNCGGLGWPWMSYFTCEDCGAIYDIETGERVVVEKIGNRRIVKKYEEE